MTEDKKEYFDCIAFKRQAQKRMFEEFEAHRDKFNSYWEYVNWKADQPTGDSKFDEWLKQVKENPAR